MPRLNEVALDWRAVGFTMLIALVSGLVVGLVPAWRASREAGSDTLRAGGRTTPSSNRLLARRTLVIVQVALSMILLVGAALLSRSLYRMRTTPTGLGQTQALAVRLNLSWDAGDTRLHEFQRRVLESFAAIPGVRSVGMTDRLPLEGGSQSRPLRLRDATAPGASRLGDKSISYRAVDPGYFETLNIPLRGGRVWNANRGPLDHRELVVNESFARMYLPAAGAVGSYLTFDTETEGAQPPTWYEVVGVVGDLRMTINQPEPVPEIYLPYQETYWPLLTVVLSASGDPQALTQQVRDAVRAIDPNQIIDGIGPLEGELRIATAEARTRTGVVGVFALAALLLAAIGLYGVLSSDVAQRTQEIGVRLALGADPQQVRWMLVRRGMVLTGAGLGAGVVAAFGLEQVMANLLFGISATDLVAFAGAAGMLAVVALAACWVPARRAARLDPVVALRRE
jgi:predicted permease